MPRFQVPEVPLRQIVWWTLGALAVAGLFWLLLRFHNVFLLLLTAIILSIALTPLLKRLESVGISRSAALVFLLISFVVLVGVFVWIALPTFIDEGAAISGALGQGYTLVMEQLQKTPNLIVRRVLPILPQDLPGVVQAASQESVSTTDKAGSGIIEQSSVVLRIGFSLVAIVLLTIYWVLDGEHIRRAAMLLVPRNQRDEVRDLLDEINSSLSSYLVGQGILCLSIGTLALIAYFIIGLPNAVLLAVFAGILEAVPVVGPILGTLPAVFIALTVSPTTALWVIIAAIIIQQLENNVLVPRVMNRTIGVNPLVTMLALLGFSSLFGILGALIALPLAAILQILLNRYVLHGTSEAPVSQGRDRLSLLYYETDELVGDVRNYVRHKTSEPNAESDVLEDEMEAIALELQSYLAAQQRVQT